jgi:hypothetical protein
VPGLRDLALPGLRVRAAAAADRGGPAGRHRRRDGHAMSGIPPDRPCTCRHGERSHFRRGDGSRGSCLHRQDEQPTACPCAQFTPDTPNTPQRAEPAAGCGNWTGKPVDGMWVNGRHPVDFEVPAVERGRKCDRERDQELLAGVLTGDPPRPGKPRPVTDLVLEFAKPQRRPL